MLCFLVDCYVGNGSDYLGSWNRAGEDGQHPCQLWTDNFPPDNQMKFPTGETVAEAGDKCRNLYGMLHKPWCFVNGVVEKCNIPSCSEVPTSTCSKSLS